MRDWQATLESQYANSPTLVQILDNFNSYVEAGANFTAFYNRIWNVATAVGYGLDVWGRIVGVGRVLQVSSGTYLGFAEASDATHETPFNIAPFYSGQPSTGNYALTDGAFRTLIYAKALSNICNGSIPAINQVLLLLFPGRGNCYCTDGGNMTMTYTFTFALSPVETTIVSQSGILPKPVGVSVTIVQP